MFVVEIVRDLGRRLDAVREGIRELKEFNKKVCEEVM